MSEETKLPTVKPAAASARPVKQVPVRVKLKRVTCDVADAYPPDGQQLEWWLRLKVALGTVSSDFVNAAIFQLQHAARLPGSGISEIAVNAALAFIESIKPQNEMEAALAMQMACTHAASMNVLGRLQHPIGGDRRAAALSSAAAKLMNAYTGQFETLRRSRNGGSQTIRIERVDVSNGGRAVIGNIQNSGDQG